MYFEEMFTKYKEWQLLQIFLKNPDKNLYTKELSRTTGIGSGTVNIFLRNLHKDKVLKKEIVGNVHLYTLNDDLALVKQLKVMNTILEFEKLKLTNKLINKDETITSIVLYGSHANGENDSKSDLDILIFSKNKKIDNNTINQLEEKLDKTISIITFTLPEWDKLKQKDKIFYESILQNHIVLYGSGLT